MYPQQPQQPYYGQPPQQQYVPPLPGSMPAVPQFSDPTMGTGGNPLKIRELENRVCGVKPTGHIPANPTIKDDKDKIVFDVLVLDGPTPFEYGASQGFMDNPPGPPVYAIDQLPALITGVISQNWEIVRECKAVLDSAPGNVIPCRIVRGQQGNRPYMLAKLGGPIDPMPQVADQARQALAQAYATLAAKAENGVLPAAVPREINGGPRKPAQQQNGAVPQQQAYPPAQYPPAPPAGQVQYAAPAYPQQQSAQQVPVPPPPPGWDPNIWASLTPAQRAPFLPAQ